MNQLVNRLMQWSIGALLYLNNFRKRRLMDLEL